MPDLKDSDLFKQAMGVEDDADEIKAKADAEAEAAEKEKAEQEALASQEAQTKDAAAKAEIERAAQEAKEKLAYKEEKKDETKDDKKTEDKVQTYDEWFAENEAKLKQYLVEKDRDYKSMKPEDLIRIKYEKENPDLSKEEIDGLLADDYSLGEKKIEIDRDTMDDDEIRAAEAHNKQIDKSLRKLNADAKKAAKDFDAQKAGLEKPVYKVPELAADPTEKYTVAEFEAMQNESIQKAQSDQVEAQKVWADTVDKNVKLGDTFAYNGVEIELSKEDHEAIKKAIVTYVPKEGDAEAYTDDKQNIIWDKFSQDVAKTVLLDKLIEAAQGLGKKEALKKASNYQSKTKNESAGNSEKTEEQEVEDIFALMKK